MRLVRLVAASAALTVAIGGFAATTSFADPAPDSNLVADKTGVTVNVWNNVLADPAHSATVAVKLDDNCANAIEHTKYTILPGDTGGFFTVSPAMSSALSCTSPAAVFTITGVAVTPASPPPTMLHFSAVAKNDGLQKKLGSGVDVQVTVVDTTPDVIPQPCTENCPVPGARPAAPAVANALLNNDSALVAKCQTVFKGKDWRGKVISTIAGAMPKPESVKDDLTQYPTDDAWITFVKSSLGSFSGLYGLCGGYVESSL